MQLSILLVLSAIAPVANTSMQWTSDVYDGLRLRTRLDARILIAILWR
ncbi:hypothetical protein ACWATR_24115 [Nostoc sp. UIC 10890]